MVILVFEKEELDEKAFTLLKAHNHVLLYDRAKDASSVDAVFIRTATKVTTAFLNKYPNLKYVIRAGVGLDTIDLEACKKRHISVINSPGANANAVSDLVVGFMIMLFRKVPLQTDELQNHKWRNRLYMGIELHGKTVGIIGCGAIGRMVAKKLTAFGVRNFLGYDPYLDQQTLQTNGIEKSDLTRIYKKADLITLHLPLTPETKNLISKNELHQMKTNVCIINTARGGIINERDLIDALKSKTIAGAALDVFEQEPEINPELLTLPNLIATPHIGGYTTEADRAISVQAVERFLSTVKE